MICPNTLMFDEVIADARSKWAKIEGWKQSPNGRIVVYFTGRLPVYYLTMSAAADSLIHQYNLISKYRYLYQAPNKKTYVPESDSQTQISVENIAIKNCDELLRDNDKELSLSMKRKVYQAIYSANSKQMLTYNKFFSIRNELFRHYDNLQEHAVSQKDKKYFKKLTRFFEEISFNDFNDLL